MKEKELKSSSDSEFRFNTNESELSSRIKKLMKDDSNVAFAKKVGMSESSVRQLLKGGSPNLDTLSKIARACGVTNSWLIGDAPIDLTHQDDVVTLNSPATPLNVAQTQTQYSNPKQYADTLYIEHYTQARAAAGSGQVTPTDQLMVNLAVNAADWRNYVGADHKNIKVITVYGDSMMPTLAHGDQILVDTACHAFIDDAIYVIEQGDLLRVKRVKLKLDGNILVKSDNTNGFEVEEYSAATASQFNIIGKVIPFKFGKFNL